MEAPWEQGEQEGGDHRDEEEQMEAPWEQGEQEGGRGALIEARSRGGERRGKIGGNQESSRPSCAVPQEPRWIGPA